MEENNKIVLPAIAVRGVVPLPANEFRIEVGRSNSVMALEASEKMYGGNIILLIQKDSQINDITPDEIEPIGVLAKITLKLKLPNNNYKVKFKVTNRIKVLEYTSLNKSSIDTDTFTKQSLPLSTFDLRFANGL